MRTFRTSMLAGAGAVALAAGVIAPGIASAADPGPGQLQPEPGCSNNYFTSTEKWEINWGDQYSDDGGPTYSTIDFGGLTYINPGTDKTPSEELQAIRDYNNDPDHPSRKTNTNAAYHWWYPSRDMVTNDAELVLGFEDGTVITGEASVGSDGCPAVRWVQYADDSDNVEKIITPDTYQGPSVQPKPEIPAEGGNGRNNLLGSLGSLDFFGSL